MRWRWLWLVGLLGFVPRLSAQVPPGFGKVENYSICQGRDTVYDSYRGTFNYYAHYLGMVPAKRLQYAKFEIQETSKVKMINVLNDLYAVSHRKLEPRLFSVAHDNPAVTVDLTSWYREVEELGKALSVATPCIADSSRYECPIAPKCNHFEHLRAYLKNSPLNRLRYLKELTSQPDVPDELLWLIAIDLDSVVGCSTAQYRQRLGRAATKHRWLERSIRVWRKKCSSRHAQGLR